MNQRSNCDNNAYAHGHKKNNVRKAPQVQVSKIRQFAAYLKALSKASHCFLLFRVYSKINIVLVCLTDWRFRFAAITHSNKPGFIPHKTRFLCRLTILIVSDWWKLPTKQSFRVKSCSWSQISLKVIVASVSIHFKLKSFNPVTNKSVFCMGPNICHKCHMSLFVFIWFNFKFLNKM